MDCHDLERRLESLLDGELTAAERAECLRHAAACASCAELLEALPLDAPAAAGSEPAGLAAAVMTATVGSPCGRSREQLCDFVDGELDDPERELVALHLVSCSGCRALAGAIEALTRDLPRLAEELPDAGFVRDVLAATLPWRVRLRRWWAATWPRWVRRPRFALEAGYLGSLVVALMIAVPGEPLAAVPKRALELAQAETASRWTLLVRGVENRAGRAMTVARGGAEEWLVVARAGAADALARTRGVVAGGLKMARTRWDALASLLVEGEDDTSPVPETDPTEEKP